MNANIVMYTEQLGGYTIKVGRNAKENDELVASASEDALWLHLHDQPSPHGIITSDNAKIDKSVIYRCGQLIKQYSKAKDQMNVLIEYLPIKYVKRTKILGLVELEEDPKIIRV